MPIRALNNQVVLKPREDLEDNWGGVIRVSKARGIEPRPVYGEVVSVGRDVVGVQPGDLVVWNLFMIGPPVLDHGTTLFLNTDDCLLAKIHDPLTDKESYTALQGLVITEAAPLAMARQISELIVLPDTVARDGMKEKGGDSPITTVFERVVSSSPRAPCTCGRKHAVATELVKGDLVTFNPLHALEWRRRGRDLRFIPESECRGVAEE